VLGRAGYNVHRMRALGVCVSASLALSLIASCGETVEDACDDYATAWCNQQYKCLVGPALTNLMTTYGPTPQDCALAYANQLNLNCIGAEAICTAGTSYDTGAAEACVTAYDMLACTDITNGFTPTQCAINLICH
jgi:hypothetical protein